MAAMCAGAEFRGAPLPAGLAPALPSVAAVRALLPADAPAHGAPRRPGGRLAPVEHDAVQRAVENSAALLAAVLDGRRVRRAEVRAVLDDLRAAGAVLCR